MYFAPMFCPKIQIFFPIPRLYFLPSSQKLSLISYYCNPGLIKSCDRTGGVWCGSHIMLSAHLPTQLLPAVVFALSPPANMPINCPDCSPFWGCTAKFMTEMMIFFLLPMHLFMGCVCAVLLLFSSSSSCLL